MPTMEDIVAALKGGGQQDAMPFGVGSPQEPQVVAPAIIGHAVQNAIDIPKHVIDAARNVDPATPYDQQPEAANNMIAANTNAAMALAGTGAPAAEAGAAGIFGGRLSKTADLDKMAYAMRNQGTRSPEQIIKESGWFQDPASGKMMYEISDNSARVHSHGLDYTQDGNSLTGPAGAIVQHSDLWKAYPQLAEKPLTNTVYQNPFDGVGTGAYHGGPDAGGLIEVNAPNLVGAKSVALHELNHGVQEIEGFPLGSSSHTYSRLAQQSPDRLPIGEQTSDPHDLYHRTAGEVSSRNVQVRMGMAPEQRVITPPWQTQDTPYGRQLIYSPTQDFVRALRHLK